MLVEIAQLATLIGCILSLYASFHTAFLNPSAEMTQRIGPALLWLTMAAGISVISGLLFRHDARKLSTGRALTSTLPFQLFCWASSIMLVLFVVSWYLETHCIFYRDVHL